MIKAIQTRYRGYKFRSRLEARWAVFFDALGLGWSYEPEGYSLGIHGAYLPDFYVPKLGEGTFIEVKPEDYLPDQKEERMWLAFSGQVGKVLLIARGVPSASICIGAKPVGRRADWEHYAVLQGISSVRLSVHPTNNEIEALAPKNAICAARSARFEHGETPSLLDPVLGSDASWRPASLLIAALKRNLDVALSDGDDLAAEEAHEQLLKAEIDDWAPWERVANG